MSEEIYSGESQTIVLRCRDRNGEGIPMAGKRADVVMMDRWGQHVMRFSTHDPKVGTIDVLENYLLCRLTPDNTLLFQGVYLVEIRIVYDGVVRIAQVPGVRILDSFTGKLFKDESRT